LSELDTALAVALGVGLAAATGFRVFVPLLVVGVASRYGYLPLGEGFVWLSTTSALLMLAAAALVEIVAYYIPGLDHLLDTIATPAAVAAGIGVSAAVMTDLSPMLKWSLAIIAGGGAAGLAQGSTVIARAHSAALTAGLGNPVIATLELIGAFVMSLVALVAPFVAIALLALFCLFILHRSRSGRQHVPPSN
jgi:hypothetical protein